MTRSLHPRCVGSVAYGLHDAKVPAAYTVIAPGGHVWYACDSDCLRQKLDDLEAEAQQATEWLVDRASGWCFEVPSSRRPV